MSATFPRRAEAVSVVMRHFDEIGFDYEGISTTILANPDNHKSTVLVNGTAFQDGKRFRFEIEVVGQEIRQKTMTPKDTEVDPFAGIVDDGYRRVT